MKNRISKHFKASTIQNHSTTDLIDELTNRFNEVVFIGRKEEHRILIAFTQGNPHTNIDLMDNLKRNIYEAYE